MTLSEWAAWLPAIILPLSTALQLRALLRARSSQAAEGHSVTTWALFLIANLGAYFAAPERYFILAHILAFLLSAILDIAIILRIIMLRSQSSADEEAGEGETKTGTTSTD